MERISYESPAPFDRSVHIPQEEVLQVAREDDPDGELLPYRTRLFVDTRGNKFVEIVEDRNGLGQEFFSRLLEGIMPVSDVRTVSVPRKSDPNKTARIQVSMLRKDAYVAKNAEQIPAAEFVLQQIFKDVDRTHLNTYEAKKGRLAGYALFDLEFIPTFFMHQDLEDEGEPRIDPFLCNRHGYGGERLENHIKRRLIYHTNIVNDLDDRSTRTLHIVQGLLASLRQSLERDGVGRIKAILESMKEKKEDEAPPIESLMYFPQSIEKKCNGDQDCYSNAFYKTLLARVKKGISVVTKELKKREAE
jgi:hypothetical protein